MWIGFATIIRGREENNSGDLPADGRSAAVGGKIVGPQGFPGSDDGEVRCREVETGKFCRAHPTEFGVFVGDGFRAGAREAAEERRHCDEDGAVIVEERGKGVEVFDLAAEFLADFADEGVGGWFTGLEFAAGEFPFEAQVFVGGTPGDQHAAVALDGGARDRNGDSFGHGRAESGGKSATGTGGVVVDWP